jgi:hypothetical protein
MKKDGRQRDASAMEESKDDELSKDGSYEATTTKEKTVQTQGQLCR